MSISTTPPPAPPKKRGLGCLGCGCLILVLLVILFLGLVGTIGYGCYAEVIAFTSTTPSAVPSFDGGDELYASARQKLADFDHDVENHQAATIQLSADEINTLLARSPNVIKNNIHAFVTLTDNEGRIQANYPTDAMTDGIIKDRYFSTDTSFEVHFDLQTKSANLTFHALQFGNKVLFGPNSDNHQTNSSAAVNQSFILWFTSILNQSFNAGIRKNPDGAALLDQAKSIEIQNGELVIETQ
jgi:hypothetical protein